MAQQIVIYPPFLFKIEDTFFNLNPVSIFKSIRYFEPSKRIKSSFSITSSEFFFIEFNRMKKTECYSRSGKRLVAPSLSSRKNIENPLNLLVLFMDFFLMFLLFHFKPNRFVFVIVKRSIYPHCCVVREFSDFFFNFLSCLRFCLSHFYWLLFSYFIPLLLLTLLLLLRFAFQSE